MQVSARSYLTAGVAFVGAGAIAVSPISPITPSLPDVQIPASAASTMPVELAALVNPIELWFNVFAETAGNIGQLADIALTDPAPILAAILRNQFISGGALADVAGLAV